MTPDCCNSCQSKAKTKTGACQPFKACKKWREWFSSEWAGIRQAAAILKGKEVQQ